MKLILTQTDFKAALNAYLLNYGLNVEVTDLPTSMPEVELYVTPHLRVSGNALGCVVETTPQPIQVPVNDENKPTRRRRTKEEIAADEAKAKAELEVATTPVVMSLDDDKEVGTRTVTEPEFTLDDDTPSEDSLGDIVDAIAPSTKKTTTSIFDLAD
jgi:hypothetical protein